MGRPRTFEPEAALFAIKQVFWIKGYEGASVDDIEQATGLNKQSLYRLYGDKRGMYLAALDHYARHEIAQAAGLLAREGDARARFEALFAQTMRIDADDSARRGCFLCNASADLSSRDPRTGAAVAALFEDVRAAFAGALAADAPYKENEDLRFRRSASLLASYFGLRVLLKSGAPIAVAQAAIDAALNAI